MRDPRAAVVRLARSPWVTPEVIRRTVAGMLDQSVPVTAAAVITALETSGRPLAGPEEIAQAQARLRAAGAVVHVVGEPGYPPRLAQAWPELGAPLWVFVRTAPPARSGRLPNGPTAAVVGTRRPTLDGLRTARALGRLLAEAGVTVVSGLARGIDQAAHEGALEAGGATVGVLGAGFGVDYPRGSGALRKAVAAAGGLVSEYLPDTAPHARNFLWRNRIISGLADVTVMVEGRARSGALATARLAAAQGRDVLVAPGSVNAPTSQGPLALLRDGARPLTRLDEVLEVLGMAPGTGAGTEHPPWLEGNAAAVATLLGAVPVTVDELARAAGLPVAAVLAAVAELEGKGLARGGPAGIVRTS